MTEREKTGRPERGSYFRHWHLTQGEDGVSGGKKKKRSHMPL